MSKREVTFINCDQCEAELDKIGPGEWEVGRAMPYWRLESRVFCGETCARAFFDEAIARRVASSPSWDLAPLKVPRR